MLVNREVAFMTSISVFPKNILDHLLLNRPISRVVIGQEFDYRSRLIYVSLTNTTLCL